MEMYFFRTHPLSFFVAGKQEVKETVKRLFEVCKKFENESDWDRYIRFLDASKAK